MLSCLRNTTIVDADSKVRRLKIFRIAFFLETNILYFQEVVVGKLKGAGTVEIMVKGGTDYKLL